MATNTKTTWRTERLGDAIELLSGGTPSRSNAAYWNGKIKWLSIPDIANVDGGYVYDSAETVTESGLRNSPAKIAPKGTIVISARGTVGKLAILAGPMAFNQSCYGIIAKADMDLDQKYLFYALRDAVRSAKRLAHGGVFDTFTTETFNHINISYPSITQQKRIAGVLAAFDEKIENNNHIVKTLEGMAQTIFKEWFVKFRFPGHEKVKMVDSELGKISEGWEIKKIPDVFDFLEGPGIRNWQYATTGCRFINIRLIQNNDIDVKSANFISDKEANGKYQHFHLQGRDMVISTSGTLGRSAIVRKEHLPLLLNTSVIRFRPKDGQSYGFMYQFLNSAYFQNKILSMASGSVQPNFGPVHLKQIDVLVPNRDVLANFREAVNPIYERIIAIKSENQKLVALRDLLLPKLMSGGITI